MKSWWILRPKHIYNQETYSCPNDDMRRTELSDGGGGSIEPDKMHIDFVVVLEGCGDRQAGREWTAEAVDKHIYLLTLILGKFLVNLWAVEVISSDVPIKRYVVTGDRHGVLRITPRSYRYILGAEKTGKLRNFS